MDLRKLRQRKNNLLLRLPIESVFTKFMTATFPRGRVRAVLGPTNTGKTYLAMDRMLGYASGIIGFPLRLLARENYDRVVVLKGKGAVALITGEEKIIPDNPRWFVCTVESMPMDRLVEFIAVDEIQLCGDPERGHIFTQRLLHARGLSETFFMGSDTIRPLLRRLVPEAEIDDRKRFSTLTYTGPKKISRLPRRSAVVAFSVNEVYAIAETIRRQRGGTAVVLGALSPRTRNAQVSLYQEGEVDYMVATDAIGMGLNMDVDHVAFAGVRKFDGKRPRLLSSAEIGQIAGRAGRHMNHGTFGVTNEARPLEKEMVEAVEAHRFDALKNIYWRNAALDFNSPKRLLKSLERKAPRFELIPARMADDHDALVHLATDQEIVDIATNPAAVRQLWEVCQIPDFRKMLADHHLRLVRTIYLLLNSNDGWLPEDWVSSQISQLNAEEGGIDSLTTRIAHIRTWTFITHRADWLQDTQHWQERTRAIEDRLSDVLHRKLTQQFVDRRAAFFDRKRDDGCELLSAVTAKGILIVEGERVGYLEGLKFIPSEEALADKAILAAARQALRRDMGLRVQQLINAQDNAFRLSYDGKILWKAGTIARIKKGRSVLYPSISIDSNDFLDNLQRQQIEKRLSLWLKKYLADHFGPLTKMLEAGTTGVVRGILFHLAEGLGSVPRHTVRPLLNDLGQRGRKTLRVSGIKVGISAVFFPILLNVSKIRLRALLWSVARNAKLPDIEFDRCLATYPSALATKEFWQATGHDVFGGLALRLDRLEKVYELLIRRCRQGDFLVTPEILDLAQCDESGFGAIAKGLGFSMKKNEEGLVIQLQPKTPRSKRNKKSTSGIKQKYHQKRQTPIDPDSPFAALKGLADRR
tara:strand:+ start:1620 stop:4220 length:2601 start_codon:yes stop_codon:yes gene_type:complete